MIVTDSGMVTPETAADRYVLGNVVYASAVDPRWPVSVRLAVRAQTSALLAALEDYEAIENGHAPGDLERAAQEIEDLTGALVAVFPACQPGGETGAAA